MSKLPEISDFKMSPAPSGVKLLPAMPVPAFSDIAKPANDVRIGPIRAYAGDEY